MSGARTAYPRAVQGDADVIFLLLLIFALHGGIVIRCIYVDLAGGVGVITH